MDLRLRLSRIHRRCREARARLVVSLRYLDTTEPFRVITGRARNARDGIAVRVACLGWPRRSVVIRGEVTACGHDFH